ncbi:hypothetical protein, partial [Escherichia coli]|uniref:hypothetical protein n=1 Tax=Escherichia coli TaxID=562 RepID=UPI001BDA1E5E
CFVSHRDRYKGGNGDKNSADWCSNMETMDVLPARLFVKGRVWTRLIRSMQWGVYKGVLLLEE